MPAGLSGSLRRRQAYCRGCRTFGEPGDHITDRYLPFVSVFLRAMSLAGGWRSHSAGTEAAALSKLAHVTAGSPQGHARKSAIMTSMQNRHESQTV